MIDYEIKDLIEGAFDDQGLPLDEELEQARLDGLAHAYKSQFFMQAVTFPLTSIAITFMILFGSLEANSMVEDGWGYFEDPWNWVDFTSLCINICFFGTTSFDYIF